MAGYAVELREVTRENVSAVIGLEVKPQQRVFVASNERSLAQAYVYGGRAWPRAVYANDELVGFVMLDLVGPDHAEAEDGRASYYVWRLMIGADHQRKGYGRATMLAVIEHVKALPEAKELTLSYVPQEGNPGGFYRSLGFEPTGEADPHGEVPMRLKLSADAV